MPSSTITGIAHVELSVRDLDVSSRWYCDLLGAREVFREPNEAENLVACAILEPNSRLVLAFTKHLAPTAGTFDVRRVGLDHVSFAVADDATLEAWAARLDELGIAHSGIQDIGYARSITFADPDGIPLELFLPVSGRR
jgi:glyoxylase I family protein